MINHTEYIRNKYNSDPEYRAKHLALVAKNKAKRKAALRALAGAWLLSHPCVDCGEDDIRVLEFDHRPGTVKKNGVCNLINLGVSRKVIQAEIDKCDVRCANCHAIKTYERIGGSWRDQYISQGGRISNTTDS